MSYYVVESSNNEIIIEVESYNAGLEIVREYEEQDREDGTYKRDAYKVVSVDEYKCN